MNDARCRSALEPSRPRACQALALLALLLAAAGAALAQPLELPAHNFRTRHFDYFVSGDPGTARAGRTSFLIALMGGGGSVDAAFAALAHSAGGGHIVILRAVADGSFDPDDGDYGEEFMTRWGPVSSAQTLVFHDREASSDPRVLSILAGADGIFIAGGDQGNYLRYWKGTEVQRALNEHVRLKRPIGGSSAGLAILGHYSYTCLDGISLESKVALPDPYNASVTLEQDFLHFDSLGDVITDSHFTQRSRLGRLIVFVARLNAQHADLKTLGLGIDEHTALLVDDAGTGRLAAGSQGSAWMVRASQPATTLRPTRPLTLEGVRVTRLGPLSLLDLHDGHVSEALAATSVDIRDGTAVPDALLAPLMLRRVAPPDEP